MRTILLLVTVIFCTISKGQVIPFDRYSTDTLHLSSFKAKKTILYKLNAVTIAVDYSDFIKMYTVFWKRYKERLKYVKKAEMKVEYPNPKGTPRWTVLDSIYRVVTADVKHKDTLRIHHTVFGDAGFGTWNNFFPELTENNRCAVFNSNNEQQRIIIRQKGFWYKDRLAAWGGRRYFLAGQTTHFIDGTDWIS